jgi:hypothetical protein
VLDPNHPITDFFDDDPERVLASLPAIERSHGKLTSPDTLYRKRGEREVRGERGGIFAPEIFGEPDSFGHVETLGVVHPCIYPKLVELLQVDTPVIAAIARCEKAWRPDVTDGRPGAIIDDIYRTEDGDLFGPRGIAEIVRRARPDHPLLPLCELTKIPVPPRAARPLLTNPVPEALDPGIGPVNEAWLEVVRLGSQDVRLGEIDTPPFVHAASAGLLQAALERAYQRTRRADGWLVPPMVSVPEEHTAVIAIAYAGPERIVIQRGNSVRVVDISGREVHAAAPCGCLLRGVVENRYAVFHDFQRDLFPFNDECVYYPADIHQRMARVVGPISVFDTQSGSYLDRAPSSLPRTLVENGEPEELFLGGRSLDEVGGDRPSVTAYTNDMRFARVSGDSSQIISLSNGLTCVRPATMYPDEVTESLDLATGEVVEHEWDDQGGGAECALAFSDGRWFLLDDYGVLCDALGNDAIVIVPRAAAAAFDPAGKRLAIVTDESELVIVDRETRAIVTRFAV